MGNAPPTTILTNQCESIKGAIRETLPDTIHRYCIWHFMIKLPIRLKGVCDYKAMKSEFKSIIFNSITIAEFEAKWVAFIKKYKLEERQRFHNLHSEKKYWVSVFLKHYFWAGMMSTQRCELMHAFFDSYMNRRNFLKQFIEQYEIALRYKYDKGLHAETDSRKIHLPPFSGFEWEIQVQTHHT
ncbi:protein FAR1-RELATED SEQUENCE 6-like [Solanum dulcamara]|uniref:protein FAR1-RELATED SEQUENCE 6-like n=1 Tax=Solanum dulcamara TaxID=45834 RepID=UPI0024853EC4|nr:protein FAR1-RELATED SEQUENCE 6-like [Solanum dulcamara]